MFLFFSREFAVNEVVAGVREYFNVMLGTQLLYKFERPQYADILANHPDTTMSQIYGAPHLLRLFGKYVTLLEPEENWLHFQLSDRTLNRKVNFSCPDLNPYFWLQFGHFYYHIYSI